MKKLIMLLLMLVTVVVGENNVSIYDFKVKTIDGNVTTLGNYKSKVMLIVNVASKCKFTPQYEGLEELHEKYATQGLSILGFPCNQFLKQEPATEGQIKAFCTSTYDVKFDMFSKIDVNGEHAHPLYVYLKDKARGTLWTKSIKWNFTKFLVDQNGKVLNRYGSSTKPSEIEEDIKKLLAL